MDKRGTLEQARISFCPVGSVKVFCVFLLTLEQTQPTLLPAGLVKTRHFEHERIDLCPAGSIKVVHLEQARSVCALPAQSKWTLLLSSPIEQTLLLPMKGSDRRIEV